MKKSQLRSYAKLIALVGANVQKGQDVIIFAELDQPEFVRMLTEECYKAGAKRVTVDFSDQKLSKIHIKKRSERVLGELTSFEKEKWNYIASELPCRIFLLSDDPNGLCDIDQEKYAKARQKKSAFIKPLRDSIEGKHQWCIAAVPGEDWAKVVFPNLSKKNAVEKLWDLILKTSRVTENPIQAWKEHNENLKKRCDYLNSKELTALHYSSSNGTDFTISLMKNALFMGGGEYTQKGVYFNPNIPSEEIFTTPKCGMCEGIVYSSMPLSYNGQLIEDFSIRFKNGRVAEIHAKKGEELLKTLIAMDDGASMLGECALVPYNSPIRNTETLFYNTLFDENAACHLALGMGFPNCIKDYEKYPLSELHAMGVNDSMIHEDFMIGTKDLNITGFTQDGKQIEIFKNGNWAFDV